MTRFEDPLKLPLGVSFNRKEFIARLLSHASYTPKILPVFYSLAQTSNFELRDTAIFVQRVCIAHCTVKTTLTDFGGMQPTRQK